MILCKKLASFMNIVSLNQMCAMGSKPMPMSKHQWNILFNYFMSNLDLKTWYQIIEGKY